MKTFLEDLKKELNRYNLSKEVIEDILQDHEEMIHEALSKGLKEEDIHLRFGEPKSLARELAGEEIEEFKHEESVDHNDFTLWKTIQPSEETIQITIDMVSQDVTYQTSKDDQIHIFYKGKNDLKDYRFSYEKGELKLGAPKMIGFLFMRSKDDDVSILIEVPSQVKVDRFKHSSVSSDISYTSIDANELQFNTTSGDSIISNANFQELKVNTVSGDVKISYVHSNRAETSQVSGDLEMDHVVIREVLHAGTVSGDIEVNHAEIGHAEFSSVNGDVEGKECYPKSISFKSISGDLDIANQRNEKINVLKTSTLSGDIKIR